MTALHVVLPGDVDDPRVPSGGNTYDRRVCDGLRALGWQVDESAIDGSWPEPGDDACDRLAALLTALPAGTLVLLDGLVAAGVPEIITAHANRLRLVVLVHLPLRVEHPDLDRLERTTLHEAKAVIATSDWAAAQLVEHHGLAHVHAVPPGTEPAPIASGTDGVRQLLCPAAVTPRKGHDLLVEALSQVSDLDWHCRCVGTLSRDSGYADEVTGMITGRGLGERVELAGPRAGAELAAEFERADLVVLTSRAETFGMVLTEALARGIPVLATEVDAVPDTVGTAGLLTPPEPGEIAKALRAWLTDGELRERLREAAYARRTTLPGWDHSARKLAHVLERV
ncbi:glycosyltransferase family 4 protein [Amycolatopsis sp. 195334CR]|uniref:glycosyltransferase family 4 protein n=1 Tax=Amycolatopsis sp. 195334CR TaxID=2814588 RepID=UPI001A8E1C63|nr:glycosyltransferase family 4 protein [Amycolatopsis sp. 195334CR]MBN6033886.1 glycosyltransferase family 4 protein [Amycolatopsis sp. 195334CR]